MTAPNPKHIITKGLPDNPGSIKDVQATMLDLMLAQWHHKKSAGAVRAKHGCIYSHGGCRTHGPGQEAEEREKNKKEVNV